MVGGWWHFPSWNNHKFDDVSVTWRVWAATKAHTVLWSRVRRTSLLQKLWQTTAAATFTGCLGVFPCHRVLIFAAQYVGRGIHTLPHINILLRLICTVSWVAPQKLCSTAWIRYKSCGDGSTGDGDRFKIKLEASSLWPARRRLCCDGRWGLGLERQTPPAASTVTQRPFLGSTLLTSHEEGLEKVA